MQGEHQYPQSRLILALLLAAVAIGLFLRLGNLLGNPFWLDEAYTAFAAEKGLNFIWRVTPQYEVHPPFYYALMSVWADVFGTSLAAYRAVETLAGLATLPVLWSIGRQINVRLGRPADRLLPAILVAFAALSPMLVQMSREVRPYALMILVYALGINLVLRQAQSLKVWHRIAYLACLVLLLWLHTLGPLFAGSLALALLIFTWRPDWTAKDYGLFVGVHATAGLLWAPAVAILLYQASGWVQSTWLGFSWSGLPFALAQTYGVPNWFAALAGMGLLATGFAGLTSDKRAAFGLAVLAFLPVFGALVATLTVSPVFIPRTLTPVIVPALAVMALGACRLIAIKSLLAKMLPAIFALALLLTALPLATRQRDQDWYKVYDRMQPLLQKGDVILAYPNESALPLRFAARDRGRKVQIKALPVEVPAPPHSGPHPTGTRGVVSIDRNQMRAATDAARAAPTIWLVQINPHLFDPNDQLGQTLKADRAVSIDWKTEDTRVRAFRRSEAAPTQQAKP